MAPNPNPNPNPLAHVHEGVLDFAPPELREMLARHVPGGVPADYQERGVHHLRAAYESITRLRQRREQLPAEIAAAEADLSERSDTLEHLTELWETAEGDVGWSDLEEARARRELSERRWRLLVAESDRNADELDRQRDRFRSGLLSDSTIRQRALVNEFRETSRRVAQAEAARKAREAEQAREVALAEQRAEEERQRAATAALLDDLLRG